MVRIVDRYMPRVADENRAYVMHYPHKVGEMLKKAMETSQENPQTTKGRKGESKA